MSKVILRHPMCKLVILHVRHLSITNNCANDIINYVHVEINSSSNSRNSMRNCCAMKYFLLCSVLQNLLVVLREFFCKNNRLQPYRTKFGCGHLGRLDFP